MKAGLLWLVITLGLLGAACKDAGSNETDTATSRARLDLAPGDSGTSSVATGETPVDVERLAAGLERDLIQLRETARETTPDQLPDLVRRTFARQGIDARLVQLLQIEMQTDVPAEEMRYSLLINALYDDLDRLDASGASKAAADRRIMHHPYMRGLYAKVVAGIRTAIGETEVEVDAEALPRE